MVLDRAPEPPLDGVSLKTFHLLKFLSAGSDIDIEHLVAVPVEIRRLMLGGVLPTRERASCLPDDVWATGHEVARRAASSKVDLIHFDTVQCAPYRYFVPLDLPCVLGLNDSLSLTLLDRAQYAWRRRLASDALRSYSAFLAAAVWERRILPSFAAAQVVSGVDLRHVSSLGVASRVDVIPNGVDVDYWCPMRDADDFSGPPSLVFVGDLRGNLSRLAEEFAREVFLPLRRLHRGLKLYVVGKGPTSLAHGTRDVPGVEVHESVPDVRPWLAKGSVVVAPVVKSGGFINKVAEGMAMGKPVVGYMGAFNGMPEALNGVHFVGVSSADEFVRTIDSLLLDRVECGRIGSAARDLVVSNYTWERAADGYASMYRSLVAGGWR